MQQTFGFCAPQTWPGGHAPQSSVAPQPSLNEPQLCCVHTAGMQICTGCIAMLLLIATSCRPWPGTDGSSTLSRRTSRSTVPAAGGGCQLTGPTTTTPSAVVRAGTRSIGIEFPDASGGGRAVLVSKPSDFQSAGKASGVAGSAQYSRATVPGAGCAPRLRTAR